MISLSGLSKVKLSNPATFFSLGTIPCKALTGLSKFKFSLYYYTSKSHSLSLQNLISSGTYTTQDLIPPEETGPHGLL
jgi:hypothetical protein